MRRIETPANQLLDRVQTWLGIRIVSDEPVARVMLNGHTIARFPTTETLEASMSGIIRRQVVNEPETLPPGVWGWQDNMAVLIDLTQPKGMEEAIRVLLETYLRAQDPASDNWWLAEQLLRNDPECRKAAEQLREHRSRLRADSALAN